LTLNYHQLAELLDLKKVPSVGGTGWP